MALCQHNFQKTFWCFHHLQYMGKNKKPTTISVVGQPDTRGIPLTRQDRPAPTAASDPSRRRPAAPAKAKSAPDHFPIRKADSAANPAPPERRGQGRRATKEASAGRLSFAVPSRLPIFRVSRSFRRPAVPATPACPKKRPCRIFPAFLRARARAAGTHRVHQTVFAAPRPAARE